MYTSARGTPLLLWDSTDKQEMKLEGIGKTLRIEVRALPLDISASQN
jgi:hypothetical protein